ncbi:probable myosin light chain kinase DDB_G0292624 [Diorhabda sublineata]|uniref:probable myosin light chain kinase DDB_G0292624 n=1 Tax=Diorhabda sublineata TaxID=1163346 RepID=UPI0024E059EE|nr:probable myosin light chain kinase DDB_G0292624 [Diorhabda sublineata]XP_056645357.1 probable myosin light chain kinase DDB_G0292624 [Diorhabda sublineata]XP_056645359.1 probable myosin light chain kinase DDB_G0292624 [Diorhabda sublineata]
MTGQYLSLLRSINNEYDLQELVGTGAFSNVYRAKVAATNATVAIKSYKIKNNFLTALFRIASEMAIMNIVNHENLIRFMGGNLTNEAVYLVLEYAPMGTLRKFVVDKVKFSPRQLQNLIRQLLNGLIYLHTLSIMHGDVKPENILVFSVEPDIMVKLSDFGLSEIIMGSRRMFKHSGTYSYMAPELHFNFPYDTSSDLYSVGVVLYELIYGRKPIQKSIFVDYLNLLRRRVEIKFDSRNGYPRQCINFVKSLLNYDKQNRPTIEELLNNRYLELTPPNHSNENHYQGSCRSFIKSSQYLKGGNVGLAYIYGVRGFLQLRLYANTITNNEGLLMYLEHKLRKYADYINALQRKLLSESDIFINFDSHINEDSFRSTLFSTSALLDAYDLCLVGNMYIANKSNDIGIPKLEKGLSLLFSNLLTEPMGERKRILMAKLKQWVCLLEKLHRDRQNRVTLVKSLGEKFKPI